MRVGWAAPGSNTYEGTNANLHVQIMNTLKRQLQTQSNQLQLDHQQEDAVDGGHANSIQFHYLLDSQLNDNAATLNYPVYAFDSNSGASGTATWIFPWRP
jgi:hypothetical protein